MNRPYSEHESIVSLFDSEHESHNDSSILAFNSISANWITKPV